MNHDDYLTQDELLKRVQQLAVAWANPNYNANALRAVIELANQPLDTDNMLAQEVAWYAYGYNLALTRMLDAIAKELK